MVAFRPKDLSKVTKIINEPEYAWSMNLGDVTFANGVLQVDLRGDYPEFTSDQIAKIEQEGFERADTFWYEITPPPHSVEQRADLLQNFKTLPSSTLMPTKQTPSLKVSFTAALTDTQIAFISAAGMKIESIPTVPLRVIPG